MNNRLAFLQEHPPHYLGIMKPCANCGILKYAAESADFCGCAKYQLPDHHNRWWNNAHQDHMNGVSSLETQYLELISRPSVYLHSRIFNSTHAFSMFHLSNEDGTGKFNQPKDGQFPTMLSICGRVYHTYCSTATAHKELNNVINWYVYDPAAMHTADRNRTNPLHFPKPNEQKKYFHFKHSELDDMHNLVVQLNPIANILTQMGQLQLLTDETHVALRFDKEAGTIMSALMPHAPDMQCAKREVLIWAKKNPQQTPIDILSPKYEPLQYPLFYIDGTAGWYCVDNTKPQSVTGHKLSQLNYYKQLTLLDVQFLPQDQQDAEIGGRKYCPLRFGRLGDLLNEWSIDMYSRVEDEKFNYLRSDKGKKKMAMRKDVEKHGAQSGRTYLPKSHIGSTRHQRAEVADSWALVTSYDKPTIFATLTFATDWPEIKEHLLEGQSAKDRPDLCARIFKLKLQVTPTWMLCMPYHPCHGMFVQAARDKIKEMWGEQLYSIGVIEYQKRGYPHAHIVIKLKNEPQTAAEINHYVQAYVPDKWRPAWTLYKQKMLHKHTDRWLPMISCVHRHNTR
jgi:hypothetical protein